MIFRLREKYEANDPSALHLAILARPLIGRCSSY